MDTPVILVTNDDGITAPGIRALVNAVKDLGKVIVVAPDSPTVRHGTCCDNWRTFKTT